MKPALGVDWDGTLVADSWPGQGDWLPGAKTALKKLVEKYNVYIYTCRIAPVSFGDWDESLEQEVVDKEVAYIRRMLDDAGLPEVRIWQEPYKLPAVAYIDNRAIRYDGSWGRVLRALRKAVA